MAGMLATFLPLVIMFGLMYLLLILPEKKRTKKYNAMLSDLKVNDKLDIYYAVSYNGQYNFCINSRGVDYRCVKNGLREISFYAFNLSKTSCTSIPCTLHASSKVSI